MKGNPNCICSHDMIVSNRNNEYIKFLPKFQVDNWPKSDYGEGKTQNW